jgi:DnaJ-class molecular chaperone
VRWRTLPPRPNGAADGRSALPHEVLGVPPDASRAEIKAAYRRQVQVYHPDRAHPFLRTHNEEVMKLLNSAYHAMLDKVGR